MLSARNYLSAISLQVLITACTYHPVVFAWVSLPSTTNNQRYSSGLSIIMKAATTTTSTAKPALPFPPAILSDVPGTWAYDTMSRRVNEEILERTVQDCKEDLDKPEFESIRNNIETLRNELRNAATTKLTYLEKPFDYDNNPERKKEWDEWYTLLQPFIDANDTWLTAPWLVTEFYAYRRLMQAFEYWNPNSVGYMYDPFIKQKRAGLYSSPGSAEAALQKIPLLPDDDEGLQFAVSLALWGNKMDLSLWPANVDTANHDIFSDILASATENLLHDDTNALVDVCHKLRDNGGGMIDIIVDNAGFELVTDLALAQYLVQSGIAKVVTFQLKSHPTFVSDALEKDLLETVYYYCNNLDIEKFPSCIAAGKKWKEYINNGSWKCVEDNFWVQPYPMWAMTEPLRNEMRNRCNLAFVKGDANYRRLLGDLTWDLTASFEDVVGCSFPVPVCALRTLKAELGCGMDKEQIERASKLDDNWMTNGRFGVVQVGKGASQ